MCFNQRHAAIAAHAKPRGDPVNDRNVWSANANAGERTGTRGWRIPPKAPGMVCCKRGELLLPDLDARFARVEPGEYGLG